MSLSITLDCTGSQADIFQNSSPGTTYSIALAPAFTRWISAVDTGLPTVPNTLTVDVSHATGDGFTIGSIGAGWYRVKISVSFQADKNQTVHFYALQNGAIIPNIGFEWTIVDNNSTYSGSAVGAVQLAVGDKVTVGFQSDTAGKTLLMRHCSLFSDKMRYSGPGSP